MKVLNIQKYHANILKSYKPHSHCNYCGEKFLPTSHPMNAYAMTGVHTDECTKNCLHCQNVTYLNPVPVGVGILRIKGPQDNVGLLLIKRRIEPFIGGLCFPGGFINSNESWQEGISREIYEETFIDTNPEEFGHVETRSTPDARRILIFGVSKKIRSMKDLKDFFPTKETSELIVGTRDSKLCFSIHQDVYNRISRWNTE